MWTAVVLRWSCSAPTAGYLCQRKEPHSQRHYPDGTTNECSPLNRLHSCFLELCFTCLWESRSNRWYGICMGAPLTCVQGKPIPWLFRVKNSKSKYRLMLRDKFPNPAARRAPTRRRSIQDHSRRPSRKPSRRPARDPCKLLRKTWHFPEVRLIYHIRESPPVFEPQ